MNKNIHNNNILSGPDKSLYNLEGVSIKTSNSGSNSQSLNDLINSLQPPTSVSASSVDGDKIFNNIATDTIVSNVLSILNEFYIGDNNLLQILPGQPIIINEAFTQHILLTTKEYGINDPEYTSVHFNVPYLFTTPDYIPNADNKEAPDNYLEIYDSKFRVTGPFTIIKSLKAVFTDPIITVSYIDRVDASTSGTTVLEATTYERGMAFEYTTINEGDIMTGFMGYSPSLSRFVFYKSGIYNGQSEYQILKNGLDTGETGILTDYNITRSSDEIVTDIELDSIYTNKITSADNTNSRKITINSHDDLYINVLEDTTEDNSSNRDYNFGIVVTGDITESAKSFTGTYTTNYTITSQNTYFGVSNYIMELFDVLSNNIELESKSSSDDSIVIKCTDTSGGLQITSGSEGKIALSSGTEGYSNSSTGQISIQSDDSTLINTDEIGKNITLGNNSIIEINNYAQIAKYMSVGITNRDLNTVFEIGGSFTASNNDKSSNLLMNSELTGVSDYDIYNLYSIPTINTTDNSNISDIANIALYPITLNIGSNSNVTRSSTLYINGTTTNALENYSIYSNSGDIKFNGTNNAYIGWSSNIFNVYDGIIKLTSNNQTTNIYPLSRLSVTGTSELFVDGNSTKIEISNENTYNITGNIIGTQSDGQSCNFKIECIINYVSNVITIKNYTLYVLHNDDNKFDFSIDTSGNYLKFEGTSSNSTNWYGNVFINTLSITSL